MTVWQDT